MGFFRKKTLDAAKNTDGTLYVTLVRSTAGAYPSYEPSRQVDVGEYGTVDRDTGIFMAEGNIFDDIEEESGQTYAELCLIERPKKGKSDIRERYEAGEAKLREVGANVDVGVADVVDTTLNFEVSFGRGHSAILLLNSVEREEIRYQGRLNALRKFPNLRNKVVVSERTTCSNCVRAVADGKETKFTIELKADVPILAGGPVTAGGGGKFNYEVKGQSGSTWVGNEGVYYPLFRLAQIPKDPKKSVLLREAEIIDDEQPPEDFVPPWEAVSDDEEQKQAEGEEEEFYDGD